MDYSGGFPFQYLVKIIQSLSKSFKIFFPRNGDSNSKSITFQISTNIYSKLFKPIQNHSKSPFFTVSPNLSLFKFPPIWHPGPWFSVQRPSHRQVGGLSEASSAKDEASATARFHCTKCLALNKRKFHAEQAFPSSMMLNVKNLQPSKIPDPSTIQHWLVKWRW